jgi:predicted Zn-dependent protease
MCEKYSYDIYSNVAKNFPLNENGIAFFKFGEDGAHNMMQRKLVDGKYQTFYTAGIAPSITGYTDKNKAVFFLFEKKGSSHTLIHEVGHLLFLAHAPGHFFSGDKRTDKDPDGKVVIQPDGFQPNAHADNQWCVMSYHKSDPDELCGICIFKLRGWLYSRINKDGTIH